MISYGCCLRQADFDDCRCADRVRPFSLLFSKEYEGRILLRQWIDASVMGNTETSFRGLERVVVDRPMLFGAGRSVAIPILIFSTSY